MANLELSSSILWKDSHESGCTSVWPLKYSTTASPVLLLTVVTRNVRPCFLLQWNLSWVKYKCNLSSFSELTVIPILLLVKFLTPRYDDSAVQREGEVKFETKFATSSQPPGMRHFTILSNSLWSKDHTSAFSYSLRDSFCVLTLIISTLFSFAFFSLAMVHILWDYRLVYNHLFTFYRWFLMYVLT